VEGGSRWNQTREGLVKQTFRMVVTGLILLPFWMSAGCADGGEPGVGVEEEPRRDESANTETSETLLGVMAGLRADMIRLSEGLWTGDFRAVADAAEDVAEHPQVGPEERVRVQSTLGGDFPDFVAADQQVHALARRVREAALREDTIAVLTALSDLQHGCVACHTDFRERLRP
jgi:hypothetical protein